MKILTLSDLHLERPYAVFSIPDSVLEQTDVCIFAGDINNGLENSIDSIRKLIGNKVKMAFFVPGNHEFYNQYIYDELEKIKILNSKYDNIHILDNETYIYNGVRFIGCTLWTDYELFGNQFLSMRIALNSLNDHNYIKISKRDGRLFKPIDALFLHQQSRAFLDVALSKKFNGETIVVTHHVPHPLSIDEKYKTVDSTPCFASNLDKLFRLENSPNLWIHGHTHTSFDYELYNTRVVCNPRGYQNSLKIIENKKFKPDLLIDIFQKLKMNI